MKSIIGALACLSYALGTKIWMGPDLQLWKDPGAELKAILSTTGAATWTDTLNMLEVSGGGYHWHERLFATLNASEAQSVADFFNSGAGKHLQVSIEAGGYLCPGSAVSNKTLAQIQLYLNAGGRIDRFMLESIFSRTMTGPQCKAMHPTWTFEDVAEQAADYIDLLAPHIEKVSGKPLEIGLIDALPHFAAGQYKADPTYQPQHGPDGLGQIGDAVSALQTALAARTSGRELAIYWADCPLDYSLHMPNGTGFDKVVYALHKVLPPLGVQAGKIFNT